MSNWVELGKAQDFPAGEKKCVTAAAEPIVVCNVDGQLHAFANICPHAGMPIGDGDLAGKVVTCPYHGYAYDVSTGRNIDFEGDVPLRTYPVRMENGRVQVDVGASSEGELAEGEPE